LSTNRTNCDLSKRRLTTSLRAGDFNGLSELRILSLEGNGIPSLPEEIFDGLSRLERLRLDSNQLASLPEEIFDGLSRLNTLIVAWGNDLTCLPNSVPVTLPKGWWSFKPPRCSSIKTRASFLSGSVTVGEDTGAHGVTVNLNPAPVADVTLGYTVGGTAIAGADYTALSGSVAVKAGENSVTLPVNITDDKSQEENETIILTLTDGVGYDLGAKTTHTLTIADNNAPPMASFASSGLRVGEDAQNILDVRVNLDQTLAGPTYFMYKLSGTATNLVDYQVEDYRGPRHTIRGSGGGVWTGSVTAPLGATSFTIPLFIETDNVTEQDETVILTLTDGGGYDLGAKTTHTLTIVDSGTPLKASFASSSQSIDEDTGTHHVTVNLDRALSTLTNFTYTLSGTATEDADYTTVLSSGFMRLGPWTTSFTIPLAITHDLIDEQDETVILTLTDGAGYSLGATKIHTLTIKDVPKEEITKPIVSFASSELTVDEAVGRHMVTFKIQPMTNPKFPDPQDLGEGVEPIPVFFTVGGTAKEGQDYTHLNSSRIAKMQAPMG